MTSAPRTNHHSTHPPPTHPHPNPGNSNDDTKHMFKERLKCRATPAFFFLRGGAVVEACTGANTGRVEYHIRKACKPEEAPDELLYAPFTPEPANA